MIVSLKYIILSILVCIFCILVYEFVQYFDYRTTILSLYKLFQLEESSVSRRRSDSSHVFNSLGSRRLLFRRQKMEAWICEKCVGYKPVYANGTNNYDGTFTCVYCRTNLKDTYHRRLTHSGKCVARKKVIAEHWKRCSCYTDPI